jgi:hypothetical protein
MRAALCSACGASAVAGPDVAGGRCYPCRALAEAWYLVELHDRAVKGDSRAVDASFGRWAMFGSRPGYWARGRAVTLLPGSAVTVVEFPHATIAFYGAVSATEPAAWALTVWERTAMGALRSDP